MPKFVSFDEMVWPRSLEDEDNSVQWRLRYGNPTKEDILYAASVMQAYSSLIFKPKRQRDKIISVLRKAEK